MTEMTAVSALALEVIFDRAKPARIAEFVEPLNAAMDEFDVVTPERQAAFLATIGHESGHLRWVRELYSGAAYDVGAKAVSLGNTPEDDGDGELHRGAGLIQITGTENQRLCAGYFAVPFEQIVDWLQTPEGASRSAAWFWAKHGCNELADAGKFREITRVVNGGYNGYKERSALWTVAKSILV
jgi:putative chitinase